MTRTDFVSRALKVVSISEPKRLHIPPLHGRTIKFIAIFCFFTHLSLFSRSIKHVRARVFICHAFFNRRIIIIIWLGIDTHNNCASYNLYSFWQSLLPPPAIWPWRDPLKRTLSRKSSMECAEVSSAENSMKFSEEVNPCIPWKPVAVRISRCVTMLLKHTPCARPLSLQSTVAQKTTVPIQYFKPFCLSPCSSPAVSTLSGWFARGRFDAQNGRTRTRSSRKKYIMTIITLKK